ncbi:UDP-N-acetylmuramoyl-L-alanyl-D-glutamate--2,6-diaminopimelate ligase [Domibacillus sp. A3M-37]|uniref:UDP-N-acetylmuramoyl-L-alanyl-D-glutamate--2, 6-diaminopimelate ligase n=1 Tax=Domibacillus sp. A3M-37 TaxID=2962037 RepID=UPI0020B88E68|nr:UDP-N-acetylmuramoyl-L-alanyl-D-glutamate--2,6-diaminopimelate ligase [Domibacillus sp. A3M-37]MCP3763626.1 UDP-N-acetylmuramoyl-L-alanyl-D-glutamate--2,6-diaminopimelate ligase [Domibacillus sp. A3M-37]
MRIPFDQIPAVSPISLFGPASPMVSGVTYNSQMVKPQFAFFAIIGENTDGHAYIEQAIESGAAAIVGTDEDVLRSFYGHFPSVTFVLVEDSREAMARVANYFYGNAQDRLIKVGVTGTNGKTTVATYVQNLFNLLHIPCGMLGTTGIWKANEKMDFDKSTPTTPMSVDIHHIFHELHRTHHEAATMEVSSIALDQKRVAGIQFDIAIHTNFSEEHLEYHKTMEHYKQSKLLLFQQAAVSIVNLDDAGMAEDILKSASQRVITYSRNFTSDADLTWTDCHHYEQGMLFTIYYGGKKYTVSVPLYGEYNAGNVTAAIASALSLGIDMEEIVSVLPNMKQAEGRFQVIHAPDNRKIVIDYAHTPVALDQILTEVRHIPHNRLIAMIAGIGIRHFGKMPKMARAAEGKADALVVTVDHPGYHDPNDVIRHVLSGFNEPKELIMTAETRKEGVIKALEESGSNDIVLLTSGCINGCQIVKGHYIPHSDEEIIREFFRISNKVSNSHYKVDTDSALSSI